MSVDAYTQHRLQCIIFQLDLSKKFKLPLILVITLYHKSVSFVYWMVHSYCDSLQQIPWACYSLDNVLCSGQCAVLEHAISLDNVHVQKVNIHTYIHQSTL